MTKDTASPVCTPGWGRHPDRGSISRRPWGANRPRWAEPGPPAGEEQPRPCWGRAVSDGRLGITGGQRLPWEHAALSKAQAADAATRTAARAGPGHSSIGPTAGRSRSPQA